MIQWRWMGSTKFIGQQRNDIDINVAESTWYHRHDPLGETISTNNVFWTLLPNNQNDIYNLGCICNFSWNVLKYLK